MFWDYRRRPAYRSAATLRARWEVFDRLQTPEITFISTTELLGAGGMAPPAKRALASHTLCVRTAFRGDDAGIESAFMGLPCAIVVRRSQTV